MGTNGAPSSRGLGAAPHSAGTLDDIAVIRRCITNCAKSRRPWQHELNCYRALHADTTPTIAYMTAQAARVVGQAIARAAA